MASRFLAAAVLLLSAVLAWLTITSTLAARALQAAIGVSVVYVGYLAYRGWRFMRASFAGAAAADVPAASEEAVPLPFISVVVPARNEATVIGAVVGDLVVQRYGAPRPAFEVVVVDHGSRDGTAERAAQAASRAGARPGLVRVVLAPEGTPPTKGAVLFAAVGHLRGEVMAVIDADARVGPDVLAGVEAAWRRDPRAAAIQARRTPVNAARSWLTAAQGEEQLMDLASQCGRRAVDGTAELRGNGMFVRCDALGEVGGWNPEAVTEDLDLSTRLAAAAHRVALAPEVAVGEEAVESLAALWWQRLRWAEGSLRRIMELGPGLLAGSAPLSRKTDFLAFATEFVIPPLFAASIVASLVTIPLPVRMDWTVPLSLFTGYGLGSFFFALAGLAGIGVRGWPILGRSLRGAFFLSHWLVVVPVALVKIAFGPRASGFRQTPRFAG